MTGFEPAGTREMICEGIYDIGRQVGIPTEIIDCSSDFKSKVVDYFVQTYLKGLTPNPCLMCNPQIKFGTVLSKVLLLGADALATGHYAQISRDPAAKYHLYKGIDPQKDQSYFLAFLSQSQLSKAMFPLSGYTKPLVRKIASENGLKPPASDESQDVCFIRGVSYSDFLQKHSQGMNLESGDEFSQTGPIEDVDGKRIGTHSGLHQFTIGQRKGINCPASQPYYVVEIDKKRNCLIVGFKEHLYKDECLVSGINWIAEPPYHSQRPDDWEYSSTVHIRVRYRHEAVPCRVITVNESTAKIQFKTSQSAVTPGQGAVFYSGNEVLGGGWIDRN